MRSQASLWGLVCAVAPAMGIAAVPGRAADLTVPPAMFDRVLAELNAKPDVPPVLATGPGTPTAPACGLARSRMSFLVPKLAGRGPDGVSRFTTATRATSVFQDAASVMVAPTKMTVNVDGSPRAYHPADPHGECRAGAAGPACALNLLCYAGVRVFENGREIRCGARQAYQRAWAEMWGEITAGRAKAVPASYWRRDPTGRSAPRYGFVHPEKPLAVMFNRKVIPDASDGRPCLRDANAARYGGYFVSATSLTGDERADEPEGSARAAIVADAKCSPLPFVDAETIPAVVIPKGGFAGAEVGDVAVGLMTDARAGPRLVYGIVGDEGPNDRFGEGTIAFNMALRGLDPAPRVGRWAGDGDVVRAAHLEVPSGRLAILILKGTASGVGRDLSRSAITARARTAFSTWGGGTEAAAKKRLAACLDDAKR